MANISPSRSTAVVDWLLNNALLWEGVYETFNPKMDALIRELKEAGLYSRKTVPTDIKRGLMRHIAKARQIRMEKA